MSSHPAYRQSGAHSLNYDTVILNKAQRVKHPDYPSTAHFRFRFPTTTSLQAPLQTLPSARNQKGKGKRQVHPTARSKRLRYPIVNTTDSPVVSQFEISSRL
jgi:hypothetical protein